jgi:TonB family protein
LLTIFSELETPSEASKRRSAAVVCAFVAEILVIVVVILLGILAPQELPLTKHYVLTWLPALTPPKPPVAQPPRKVTRVVVPKLKSPEPPKLVAPTVAELKVPNIRPVISPATLAVRLPPPPVPQPSLPSKPREPLAIHTGIFGGAEEKVTTKRPVEQVQTGGFGSLQGLPVKTQSDSPGNVPKLGSFGLPEGPGVGNGTGGRYGVQGVVASAGFGSGVAGAGYGPGAGGNGESKVAVGGFGTVRQVGPAPSTGLPHVPPPAEFQPIEILSKPVPAYTEEARRLGIQGEVALSVVFLANGSIRVNGVEQSLGHGLDQEAARVATQIRFKPALRAGEPVDFSATVRIEFRLAGQTSYLAPKACSFLAWNVPTGYFQTWYLPARRFFP